MKVYISSHAFQADVEAMNDDRDFRITEEEALPRAAWIWTNPPIDADGAVSFNVIKALSQIEEEVLDPYMMDNTEDPENKVPTLKWQLQPITTLPGSKGSMNEWMWLLERADETETEPYAVFIILERDTDDEPVTESRT